MLAALGVQCSRSAHRTKSAWPTAVVVCLCALTAGCAQPPVELQSLGPLPPCVAGSLRPGKRGLHVACETRPAAGGARIFHDGVMGPVFEAVDGHMLSPDGEHVTYGGVLQGRAHMVRDTHVGPGWDAVGRIAPGWSADSEHLVGVVQEGNALRVVVDGQPSPAFDKIGVGGPVISPDGSRVAWLFESEEGWQLWEDGPQGQVWEVAAGLRLGPKGRHIAYAVTVGGASHVICDGTAGPAFRDIGRGSLQFSPQGTHIVYVGQRGDRWHAVLDHRPGAPYDGVLEGTLTFSADDRHFAYGAHLDGEKFVVRDGERRRGWDTVNALAFDVSGERLMYGAKSGDMWHVVVDGIAGPPWEGVGQLTFSPDGSRVAYLAQSDGGRAVVVDDEVYPSYDDLSTGVWQWPGEKHGLLFSPDGARLAYVGEREGQYHVVLDGKEGPGWDLAVGLTMSPDSVHFAYFGTAGDTTRVIVDGEPGATFDGVVAFGPHFLDGDTLQYLAFRNDMLYRVTHHLER